MFEVTLKELNIDFLFKLFGTYESNVKLIENALAVKLLNRGDGLKIVGEDVSSVDNAKIVIEQLEKLSPVSTELDENTVNYVIAEVIDGKSEELSSLYSNCICLTAKGKPLKAKTVGQQKYVNLIKTNTVIMGVGPAGTGKTFLAVAMAVTALKEKKISKIILTRPAVEAGEKLGFLPGDLQSKIDPYLRPLYDALGEMLGNESFQKHLEKGTIEIAPLAYMRGRTLDDAFIILDEAQNTTPEQMKMFLTRLGNNSKAIVTGDVTQIDLPFMKKSGLIEALDILDGIEGIAIYRFSHKDVVRHPLVQKIILAYEKNDTKKRKDGEENQRRRFRTLK
ncbi:MAG: phosphate starvation-inducible protein PhoH [Ruminococcaceae bacterium]|nr:phosphate starvation-inducible protein PhoH [Oscillospiraceae bacterium]